VPDSTTVVATFAAGVLSFFAPCTVPLLPAYLSYVSGLSAVELAGTGGAGQRRRLLTGTALFVLGFGIVFVLLGIGAGGLGATVHRASRPVEVIGGALMVVFGAAIAGLLIVPRLQWERRLQLPERLRGAGLWAALPLGISFGIGWTPCVGPYLASALTLAAVGAHVGTGAFLLGVYALGLGMPFVVTALLWASLPDLPRRAARLALPLARIGGGMLIVVGVLLATGAYSHLTSVLASLYTPAR